VMAHEPLNITFLCPWVRNVLAQSNQHQGDASTWTQQRTSHLPIGPWVSAGSLLSPNPMLSLLLQMAGSLPSHPTHSPLSRSQSLGLGIPCCGPLHAAQANPAVINFHPRSLFLTPALVLSFRVFFFHYPTSISSEYSLTVIYATYSEVSATLKCRDQTPDRL